jgi:hypothetical protein
MENKPTKVCRRCRKRRPLEAFETVHHKNCKLCRIKLANMGVAYAEHIAANPPPLLVEVGKGLNATREGMNKYNREYYRDNRMDPNRKVPRFPSKKKLCRRCQVKKKLSDFGSWRVRICKACDGPSLEDLINNPPKLRIERELPPLDPEDEDV